MEPRVLLLCAMLLVGASTAAPQKPLLFFDFQQPSQYFVQDLKARDATGDGMMYYASPVKPLPGFFIKPIENSPV